MKSKKDEQAKKTPAKVKYKKVKSSEQVHHEIIETLLVVIIIMLAVILWIMTAKLSTQTVTAPTQPTNGKIVEKPINNKWNDL